MDKVLQRYIKYMAILTAVAVAFGLLWSYFGPLVSYRLGWVEEAPVEVGDFYVRRGDQYLGDGEWDQAVAAFDEALAVTPDHRGALMGRAIAFLQSGRGAEARAELDYLIDFLEGSLGDDDPTGRGVLAAAYANRGILNDREGHYRRALDDYIASLRVDQGAVEGPGVIHKILYGSEGVSSVRDRARYLAEQFEKPEAERVFRVEDIDARQRMHKP